MQCAQCHGANGEGVDDEYDKPLYGDRSVDRLANLIERTMPEDEPELCVGDDAAAVSAPSRWLYRWVVAAFRCLAKR